MDVFEALADPTRREIIAMLAVSERNAGEIASRFDMAGPSVSRHLKVLRESGLITYRSEAQSRIYQLNAASLDQVQQWMQAQIDLCRERFDRLGAHLDRIKKREAKNAKDKRR
ncbi:MAG TPA: metalloregulator ArsR/SmtB family transcription factor [Candidatus Binataceae bacterium]|jgi:DNA-binding transcriptional ArsR family regulator|nr:metalloregulator ArsR/SmtB family transcription factor [Candidatus Binataceae bacterium]